MKRLISLAIFTLTFGLSGTAFAADAVSADAKAAYADIEATFGIVPTFLKVFPADGIAGAWAEMKNFQLNPHTALSNKEKELIGLAVAAQIPCHYCIYFHTEAAKANGATDEEVREAIAMSAATRHWSTVLNGSQIDMQQFKKEFAAMMKFAGDKAEKAKATAPAPKKKS
ncbi:carboxymuconolactone decarboxylase family protein [Rudaea sp.]|uniref:carboxymuconolactone decarboxylase family protein n=1 Tax=Rudaea sp. TaxID=2136325 RepID=UPI002ED02212